MISLIILAYNDGQSIKENLPGWVKVLEGISSGYEIIVADDGSSDDTPTIMKSFITSNRNIKYVRSDINHGVGANFRMGIRHSTNKLVAYTDGDGQYLPADLLHLWKAIESHDMVTGKRINRADPALRSITSMIYNKLVKCIYPVPVSDINSGLKMFTRRYIECCQPQQSEGPFYDAEYLIKGYKNGLAIKEIPIAHQSRKYGNAAGISFRSIRFLFAEVCRQHMKPYTRNNYLSKIMFRFLCRISSV